MTENQKLNLDFEKAIRMMAKFMPEPKEDSRKPVLFHDIRVGVYLYENGYSSDIVLSGLLHDALEFSEISEDLLRENFGEKVLEIVKANSKDRTIEDSNMRIEENILRCAKSGEEALIVKTADILDSFKHYTTTQNENELEYCRKTIEMIKKHKPENFNDPIHDSLGAIEAEKILKKLDYSKETIKEVVHAVASHRAKKGAKPKTLIAKIVANADAMSHFDMLPIFYYWQGQRNGEIGEWTEWVENKLKHDWEKKLTLPEAKKMVAEKYKAIKFLIKTVR